MQSSHIKVWLVIIHANHFLVSRRFTAISPERWKMAGYILEEVYIGFELLFLNGSFYSHWWRTPSDASHGIACLTTPLEGNSSTASPIPILLVPYPEMLRNANRIGCLPHMITRGSRLLLITSIMMPV